MEVESDKDRLNPVHIQRKNPRSSGRGFETAEEEKLIYKMRQPRKCSQVVDESSYHDSTYTPLPKTSSSAPSKQRERGKENITNSKPETHKYRINHFKVDNRTPTKVAYERWGWPPSPKRLQLKSKRVLQPEVTNKKTETERVSRTKDQGTLTDGRWVKHSDHKEYQNQRRDHRHRSRSVDRLLRVKGTHDLLNQTFTKDPEPTTVKTEESRNRKTVEQGTVTDQLRKRDKSAGRSRTRYHWTLTDADQNTREQEIQTASTNTRERKEFEKKAQRVPPAVDAEPQMQQPARAKVKKSVAFYVPLFCNNCDEPMEPGPGLTMSKKGTCRDCQKKFKWFCNTGLGEDGFYDAKGPKEIQVKEFLFTLFYFSLFYFFQ